MRNNQRGPVNFNGFLYDNDTRRRPTDKGSERQRSESTVSQIEMDRKIFWFLFHVLLDKDGIDPGRLDLTFSDVLLTHRHAPRTTTFPPPFHCIPRPPPIGGL